MMDKKSCFLCAWRATCQKRFSVTTDMSFNIFCPDYSRDVTIRESDIDKLIVEQQIEHWKKQKQPKYPYIITVSRETGSGGSAIARMLATDLGMDLMSGQIIQRVADKAKMNPKVIEYMDEKAISTFDSIINSFFSSRHIWPTEYFRHLSRVILTIGKHGNAIVVGRGAHLILPRETTFRVRVIAPPEYRMQRLMTNYEYSEKEAKAYMKQRDTDRLAYAKKYFHSDPADLFQYDMVLNTEKIGTEGGANSVKMAFYDWQSKRQPVH